MANPTCSATTLVTEAASYRLGVLNPKQQKALLLYAKALELAAIDGTDYTSVMDSTLLSAAASLEIGLSPDDRTAARIALAFTNATAGGASVPATLQAKLEAVANLVNADDDLLDRADVLLTCNLGVHKDYPQ